MLRRRFISLLCNSSEFLLTGFLELFIRNGNRTEWSPIWPVIIRVITKLDDREVGVRFVFDLNQIG